MQRLGLANMDYLPALLYDLLCYNTRQVRTNQHEILESAIKTLDSDGLVPKIYRKLSAANVSTSAAHPRASTSRSIKRPLTSTPI